MGPLPKISKKTMEEAKLSRQTRYSEDSIQSWHRGPSFAVRKGVSRKGFLKKFGVRAKSKNY